MEPASESDFHQFRLGDALPTVYYVPDFVTLQQEEHLLRKVYEAPSPKWKTVTGRRLQGWGGVVHPTGLISQTLPTWLSALSEDMEKQTRLFPSPINHVLVNEYLPGQGIMSHQDGPLYHPVVAILSLQASAVITFTPHSTLHTPSLNPGCLDPSDPLSGGCRDGGEGGAEEGQELSKNGCERLGKFRVWLEPRSLVVFKDRAYTDYLHGIEEKSVDHLDSKVLNWSVLQHRREMVGKSGGNNFSEKIEHMDVRREATRISLTCRMVLKTRNTFLR